MSFEFANRVIDPESYTLDRKEVKSNTSFARVYYWHYKKQNFGPPSNVREPDRRGTSNPFETFIDVKLSHQNFIESDISGLRISKSIDEASATFDLTLLPSVNWKKFIFPGDWVAIYLFNSFEEAETSPNNKNLVLLGNVDRVARSLTKDEDTDTTLLRYKVTGRNFGKVLEETDIWYDPYLSQDNILDIHLRDAGLELIGNPSQQLKSVLDIFLGAGLNNGKTTPLKQWRIPDAITSIFKTTESIEAGASYIFDVLRIDIEEDLPGYRTRNMLQVDSNGNLYEMMKRSSNELVNQLVIEEKRFIDGVFPCIQLKPRPFNTPFFEDNFGTKSGDYEFLLGKLNGKVVRLKDLAKTSFIQISPTEVVYEDLGKDDHSRMNMFILANGQMTDLSKAIWANFNEPNIIGNPLTIRESISRHGLKRFESSIEFDLVTKGISSGSEVDLFKAFMMQIYDQNFVNHLYENGTIECTGILEAELGKALILLPSSKGVNNGKYPDGTKVFFIEGYEHTLEFPNRWKTIFTVSKGQFLTADNNIFIDVADYDSGKDDVDLATVYVAQTDFKKDGI